MNGTWDFTFSHASVTVNESNTLVNNDGDSFVCQLLIFQRISRVEGHGFDSLAQHCALLLVAQLGIGNNENVVNKILDIYSVKNINPILADTLFQYSNCSEKNSLPMVAIWPFLKLFHSN